MEQPVPSVLNSAVEAARRLLLPFFRAVTFFLLFGFVFLSLIVLAVQQAESAPTGLGAWLNEGGLRLLQSNAAAIVMGFGFVGLFLFRVKEKILVFFCLAVIAFLLPA